MPTLIVSKQVTVSPDALWAVLADFGDVAWIPGSPVVDVDGDGPGMKRTIQGGSGQPVAETLLWIKPADRALSYEIANSPLPVTKFVAVVTVTLANGADPGAGATITWNVEYEPDGDDTAARAAIEGVYGMMADWLQDAATSKA